jgi:hypothetical protein
MDPSHRKLPDLARRASQQSATHQRLTRQWLEVLERDVSHPCIIAWVPFNESWGVPNLPRSIAEREWVQALYYLTKTTDPSRPVVGNDGWESVATDIIGIHDYDEQADRMERRYGVRETLPALLKRERPGGRALVLEDGSKVELPIVLSEFGGIALADPPGIWGYSTFASKLDGLFDCPMPYVMVFHQAPTDGNAHPEAHLHAEIYPFLRMRGRLKYLAGSELGAGTFTADTLPEKKARELQSVEVPRA